LRDRSRQPFSPGAEHFPSSHPATPVAQGLIPKLSLSPRLMRIAPIRIDIQSRNS
jgi:hypothetical protein